MTARIYFAGSNQDLLAALMDCPEVVIADRAELSRGELGTVGSITVSVHNFRLEDCVVYGHQKPLATPKPKNAQRGPVRKGTRGKARKW